MPILAWALALTVVPAGLQAQEVAPAEHVPGATEDVLRAPTLKEAVERLLRPDPAETVVVSSGAPTYGSDHPLWRDPAFFKRFIESYIPETDIEPGISNAVERDLMVKVMEVLTSDGADKMDRARTMLENARTPASGAVIQFTLANIYFQQDDLKRAAEAYRQAVEKHGKFRRAWRNLALIYVRERDLKNAVPALTRVIELGGGDALMFGLLGYAHSLREHHLAAESAYRMAHLLDPSVADWKMGLMRSLFKQLRYTDAEALTRQLLSEDPSRVDLWLLLANAQLGLNQPMRAAESYEVVVQMGHGTPEILYMLGDIYTNDEAYELALLSYLYALKLPSPQGAERLLRAAKVLIARGAHEETQLLVQAIHERFGAELGDEERKDLLRLKARLAVAQGGGDTEIVVLEEIVALDPLDGEALILLGQHAVRKDQVEQAVFYFERAAGLEKFEADAKVRHAQLLVSKNRYAEALPLLRSAQKLKPRDNIQQYMEQVERIARSRGG